MTGKNWKQPAHVMTDSKSNNNIAEVVGGEATAGAPETGIQGKLGNSWWGGAGSNSVCKNFHQMKF